MADLSDSTNWFETDASNNKASPNGWPEGMMPSGVNDSARGDKGALKRFWDRINPVQQLTPSGGVWTFTTSNAAYPAAYVDGEVYSFKAGGPSVGGDTFQINSLGAKPIYKIEYGGFIAIIAQDIVGGTNPQLVYQSALNAGAGGFLLTNPFLPVLQDGAGGLVVSANLAVLGALSAGATTLSGLTVAGNAGINSNLTVSGASGIHYSAFTGGGSDGSSHAFRFGWSGANIAVSVDGTPGIQIANAAQLGAYLPLSGGVVTGTGGGGGAAIYATGGAFRSDVGGTALYLPNGDISCQNIVTAGSNAGGAGSGVAILCNNGAVQVSRSGTAFYAPNGNGVMIECHANAFVNTSDAALKTDLADLPDCLALLAAISPQRYRWREGPDTERTHWGFVAQDVEAVMDAAGYDFGGCGADGEPRGLAYAELVAALWKACQELAARVSQLEAK